MRRTPGLLFSVPNQTLQLRFPDPRPTSATFSVLRAYVEIDDSAPPEFSGTATLDPVNTTTVGVAGAGQADPQLIVLASNAGLVASKKYLLSQNAVSEWVDLVEIQPSFVRVRYPLEYGYTTGASLASTWLTAAVDNTWISDISKISDLSDTFPDFRVKWNITDSTGALKIIYSFFDVVRAQVRHNVEIDDINARAPGLRNSLPVEYRFEDGRPLIDAAWLRVRAHLQAMNIQVDAIREDEVIDEIVVLASLRLLAEAGWHPQQIQIPMYLDLTTKNYERFLEQHFAAVLKHRLDYQLGPLSRANALPMMYKPFWGK